MNNLNAAAYISIVIPLYNKEKSVSKCVESILKQTYKNYEVIIVNDGSTDGSLEKVQKLTKDFPEFKVYSKENGGVSSARNHGIQKANFEYIAFLDADDIWDSSYLQTVVELYARFPNINMLGVAYRFFYGEKVVESDFYIKKNGIKVFDKESYFAHARKNMLFFTSAVVVRKEVLKNVGLFDERIRIGEDLDMWFRVVLSGNVLFFNEPLVLYNRISENPAGSLYKDFTLFFHNYVFEKYVSEYSNSFYFRQVANELIISGLLRQALQKNNFAKIYSIVNQTIPNNLKHKALKNYYHIVSILYWLKIF